MASFYSKTIATTRISHGADEFQAFSRTHPLTAPVIVTPIGTGAFRSYYREQGNIRVFKKTLDYWYNT